jgi:hypothetical protein
VTLLLLTFLLVEELEARLVMAGLLGVEEGK